MKDVTIYTTKLCGYCSAAKRLLASKGADFREIDVTFDRAKRDAMVERSGGQRTTPQIFIGTEHVGGCDELHALEHAGQLGAMLAGQDVKNER